LNSFLKIWQARHMIVHLSFAELKVRYKGTVLGFVWSIIEPLAQLAVLFIVFTAIRLADENFVVYLFIGLIFIHFFTGSTTKAMNSLIINKSAIISLNIPKQIFPFSVVLTYFYMLAIEMCIFFLFIIGLKVEVTTTIFIYPAIIGLLYLLTLGISFILATIRLYFKDIQSIWLIVSVSLIFITPVFWKVKNMDPEVARIIMLNPLATLLEMAHEVVLFNVVPTFEEFRYAIVSCLVIFFIGWALFAKLEKRMVEKL